MKRIIVSTLMAIVITLATSAAFAAEGCIANGKAYVNAATIATIAVPDGPVYLLAPENNWGKGANVNDFVMTKEADGRYSIAEGKVLAGKGHPARREVGRAAKAAWPDNYAWAQTATTKHISFDDCK